MGIGDQSEEGRRGTVDLASFVRPPGVNCHHDLDLERRMTGSPKGKWIGRSLWRV